MAAWLSVVMNDLEEVVLAILEDHEDTFLLEDDFDEMDEVRMGELGAKGDFADGGLRETGVLDVGVFFVGLESSHTVC